MISSFLRILLFVVILGSFSTSHAEDKTATTILLFGDSIIAGYGLSEPESLSIQLEKIFAEKGKNIKVINGGVSGDTTGAGRSRLEWTIKKHKPDYVFLALGGNDVLRGINPDTTQDNLSSMLYLLKANKIPTILSSVNAPPNLGLDYMNKFNRIYDDLSDKYEIPLYPFLLKETFNKSKFMQKDQIHPNAEGIKVIAAPLGKFLLKNIND